MLKKSFNHNLRNRVGKYIKTIDKVLGGYNEFENYIASNDIYKLKDMFYVRKSKTVNIS